MNESKMPVEQSYKTLEAALNEPYCYETTMSGRKARMELHNPDMWKFGRAENLHVALNALLEFTSRNNGELPRLSNEEDA